ncbi:MAG: hypothetical protein ACI39N_04720 [Lachnospiraceae bacterium]
MERKVKMGLSAMMIVAMTFSILGIVFLPIGIAAWVGNWDIEGEPIVFVAMFTGLGTVFLALGILFLFLEIRKYRISKQLLEDGYYVIAEIVTVERNLSVTYGSQGHPYVVKCSYEDSDGTIHIFRSRNLYAYPGQGLEGQLVRVYLNRNNHRSFKDYYVDIDEILPKVVEH